MQNDNCQMDNFLRTKFEPSALSVTSQEPSAVPPTHESCDESEDDEWKYMKEGQGEKQLLGLQGDIVVEEDIQQSLQEEITTEQQQPEAKLEQQPLETATAALTEEVVTTASDQIETIKDTFESLTQNIADLAENAAASTETVVDKIGDTLESLNLSQSSTREKLDNIDDDEDISASEMNSKLNPEAKEFIPTFSPTGPVDFANGMSFGVPAAKAIPHHFKDELIAQSPRKGRESNMENINLPAENEFSEEIAHKPHGLPGDEIITENVENGGLYQEMNWKEAMHGSEKEEGPLVDSPITEESLEVVENVLQYGNAPNLCDFSAPVGLDNAGMKESIYIENNTSLQSNEEDVLNTVQVLPVEAESQENSLEAENAVKEELISGANEIAPAIDVVTDNEVQQLLTLAGAEKKEEQVEESIEKRMEELLLSHDREITKDVVPVEAEQVPINGVEMSPTEEIASTPIETAPVVAAIAMGTAAAVAVAATTTAVKKAEAEKNQKNLIKTSSATKSKVPDTKKPTSATASKAIGSSATAAAAKRSLGDKPKPSVASSLATKKTASTTTTAAPRPRTAPSAAATKTIAEKKTTTTTTSTAKSRIDSKAPITLATRKPLTSTATRTSASKPGEDAKSGSTTTVKSSISGKPLVGSKTSVGSAKPLSAANSITKTRPATASAAATTNGTATKTAAPKPTTLAPKSAGLTKPSVTSPRGTLSSTLRKTEAIKSPVKTTASTITSRTSLSTNGTKTTTSTRTTTTTKTSSSSVPAAAKSTTGTTTTTRRTLTSTGNTSTVGATTPTSKTPNNLVSRKPTPLKKATTPAARKSIGSKLNASATKPTKDTTTPRPVTIPPQHQNNNNSIVGAAPKADIIPLVPSSDIHDTTVTLDNGEPKLNGIATPDDLTSPTAIVAQSLVDIA